MSRQIIGLQDWFETPAGRYLLEWERACVDDAVADIFGYHALQLGTPELDGLRANRMPHRWLACDSVGAPATYARPALLTDFTALPFPSSSLDLVVLPHTLEFSANAHACLREVERVLVPEGRIVICGLNPSSLWGLLQARRRLYRRFGLGELFLPEHGSFIAYRRLRDWLHLLSFEVDAAEFGCYRPGLRSAAWLQRFAWMDSAGERWWPIFGAAYFVVAVKRVRGMRLLGPAWKSVRARAGKGVSLANRASDARQTTMPP